jgi:hypothetical protein
MSDPSMPGEPGPETDDSQNPTSAAPGDEARQPFRDMLIQLQGMIDTVAERSGPVLREVAAKAAELAAVAGERAGPIAYKAAEATQKIGQRVAETSKEVAADLRRQPGAENGSATEANPANGSTTNHSDPVAFATGFFVTGVRLAAVLLGLRFLAPLAIARFTLDLRVARVREVPARAVIGGLEHVAFSVLTRHRIVRCAGLGALGLQLIFGGP